MSDTHESAFPSLQATAERAVLPSPSFGAPVHDLFARQVERARDAAAVVCEDCTLTYRELDARHPGSKFILTIRERDGWLKSCKRQFTERLAEKQNDAHKHLFLDLYGTDVFDEQRFGRGYDRFVAEALAYFARRPQDLLVIDIAGGEGWEKLCAFLGKPIPDAPFPKSTTMATTPFPKRTNTSVPTNSAIVSPKRFFDMEGRILSLMMPDG
jgi:hypothetical protein